MRLSAKVDANQSKVVSALRQCGASVCMLHNVGSGCPDIVVGWKGVNILMEIKDGSKPPSARRLTPDQISWHAAWGGQVAVVCSEEEAVDLLKTIGESQ